MANEETDKLPKHRIITGSHRLFAGIKSIDHRSFFNQNMPVTWHGPEPE
jgi:hypothetical protein